MGSGERQPAGSSPDRTRSSCARKDCDQLVTSCLVTAAISASWRESRSGRGISIARADHVGGLLDVVGIDDERIRQLLRRSGELRQDEHTGVLGVLRGHVLLGHQVHAVAQRRHHADAGGAVDAGQPPARRGAMDVVDRHPVELAEAAVDRACERLQLLADVGIGLHAGARRRRDLRQHHLALILRVLLQEAAEGLELVRQALGVVETVDADDAGDRGRPLHEAAGALGLGEIRHVDADREARDRDETVEQPDTAVRHDAAEYAVGHVVEEVGDIRLRLQADEIVGGERARQLLMLRDGHEGLPGRKRNVQIEADCVLHPALPELGGERDQVVVVHPDDVVGAQHRRQHGGEAPVDRDEPLEEAGLELGQIEPVVKDRPQHRVGVAQIIALVIGLGERDGGEAAFASHHVDGSVIGRDLAVPAEPQTVVQAHDVGEGHSDAAGLRSLAQIDDPIGDQDDATHTRLAAPIDAPKERDCPALEQDRFRLNHLVPTATWRLKRKSCSTS